MATQTFPVDQALVDTSRHECLDGQLVERPFPNDIHSQAQFNITAALKPLARGLGCIALQEWTLDASNQPRHDWMTPDVLVASRGSRASNGHCLPPALLAVEILSPGQGYAEMREKARRYFRWGVSYVWIVDPASRTAEAIATSQPDQATWLDGGKGVLTAGELQVYLQAALTFE